METNPVAFNAEWFEAGNPETAPERLRQLAMYTDSKFLPQIAKNPNVPIPLLISLIERHPHEALSNPIFSLCSLEDPGFWLKVPENAMLALIRKCFAVLLAEYQEVLFSLAYQANDRIKRAILEQAGVPEEILAMYATSPKKQLQYPVAANPTTPPSILRILAAASDKWCRGHVAQNPNTSYETLIELVRTGDQWTRGCVLNNPRCDEKIRKMIGSNA